MITLILDTPIKKGEVEISELTFKSPKTGDLLAVDDQKPGSVAADLALVSRLTGVATILLKEMEPEDWARVRVELKLVYSRFMGTGRATMAAVLALDLDEGSFAELVRAYATSLEVDYREFLLALVDAEDTAPVPTTATGPTVAELNAELWEMVADVLAVFPGLNLPYLLTLGWDELLAWRDRALARYKLARGIT